MKQCSVFNKGLCLGCTGLGEKDWIGPEECSIYKKNNISGLDMCKKILSKGEQMRI